jgi:Fe-S cluster assembly iron-binding protein IscA
MIKLSLTISAEEELKKRTNERGLYLKLSYSENSINFYFVDKISDKDEVISCNSLKILIEKNDLNYFDGVEIHYIDNPGEWFIYKKQS